MPMLINTPEGWFRTHHRDIHMIEYDAPENYSNLSARDQDKFQKNYRESRKNISNWIRAHMPHADTNLLESIVINMRQCGDEMQKNYGRPQTWPCCLAGDAAAGGEGGA